ncbi:MAG: hypothetical protein ACK5IC_07675 [Moheibacter sp.]
MEDLPIFQYPKSAVGSFGMSVRLMGDKQTVVIALYNSLSVGSMFDNHMGNSRDKTIPTKYITFIWRTRVDWWKSY